MGKLPAGRRIVFTVELNVRDMTPREWDEANEGVELDDDEGPDGWVADLEPQELTEIIESALLSTDNPEMFAGSGLFVVIDRAECISAKWATA